MAALPRHHATRHPMHPGVLEDPAKRAARLGPAGDPALGTTRLQDSMPAVPKVTHRERLSTRFLQDFHNHWAVYGRKALHQFYQADPGAYCRMAGSLIPKHIDVRAGGIDEFRRLSSADVRALMREAVRDALTEQGATVDGEHEYIVDEQLNLLCGPATGEAGGAEPGPAPGDAAADPHRGAEQGVAGD